MEDGILLDKDVVETYEQLKTSQVYRYLIFTITEDKKMIEIEKKGEQEETYWDFLKSLPQDEARYCVFDYNYVFLSGKNTRKQIYIYWCPEGIKVANEIAFSSNNEFFQSKLKGLNFTIHAVDYKDLAQKEIEQRIEKIGYQ